MLERSAVDIAWDAAFSNKPLAGRLENLRKLSSREYYISEYRLSSLHQIVLVAESFDLEPLLRHLSCSAIDERDAQGRTALYWAALRGDSHYVSLLLKAGADYDSADDYGSRILSAAVISNNTQCVQAVLQANCNIHYIDADGYTPLHRCGRYSDNVEIVKLLLAYGADVNAKETRGFTPLMIATYNRHSHVARLLIDRGAKLDVQAKKGECALHHAIMAGDHHTVRYLLDRGADYRLRTNAKEMFLHYVARKTGDQKMLSILQAFPLTDAETTHKSRSLYSSALQLATSSPGCDSEWLEMFTALLRSYTHQEPLEKLNVGVQSKSPCSPNSCSKGARGCDSCADTVQELAFLLKVESAHA